MSYFEELIAAEQVITKKANDYLDKLPFMSNDEVMEKLHKIAWKLFRDKNENFDAIPDWAATIVDGWMPYVSSRPNGSLNYTLGFSVASQDAHLRNLLEIAEGREEKELDFDVVAKID
jgi:hypothetical protein